MNGESQKYPLCACCESGKQFFIISVLECSMKIQWVRIGHWLCQTNAYISPSGPGRPTTIVFCRSINKVLFRTFKPVPSSAGIIQQHGVSMTTLTQPPPVYQPVISPAMLQQPPPLGPPLSTPPPALQLPPSYQQVSVSVILNMLQWEIINLDMAAKAARKLQYI